MHEHQTLTLQEVCVTLRITRHTAMALIGRGELIAFKVGQAWRIDAGDLAAYIARQKHAAHARHADGETAWAG